MKIPRKMLSKLNGRYITDRRCYNGLLYWHYAGLSHTRFEGEVGAAYDKMLDSEAVQWTITEHLDHIKAFAEAKALLDVRFS